MQKSIYFESIDSDVIISRRRGTRNLRLSIRSDGRVRLTIPYGVSQNFAEKFIAEKAEWINKHKKTRHVLRDGMHIGKSHRLVIEKGLNDVVKTRISHNEVKIKIPSYLSEEDAEVQDKTLKACEKALKQQAEILLPQRLEFLSNKHDISYKSINVKKFKSRWGSCDSKKNIILNIYLMQIDWNLIDYVILHELTHTLHQHHQQDFWDELAKILPNYKELRKELKTHPTNVFATNF